MIGVMNFLDVFILMLPVVIPVFLGYFFVKIKIFTAEAATSLLRYVLYITFPSVIIANLSADHLRQLIEPRFSLATILITLLMYGVTYVLYRFFFRSNKKDAALASLLASFVSSGIVGLPLMLHVIGTAPTLVPV